MRWRSSSSEPAAVAVADTPKIARTKPETVDLLGAVAQRHMQPAAEEEAPVMAAEEEAVGVVEPPLLEQVPVVAPEVEAVMLSSRPLFYQI
ncbi:MAG: hypothetical protein VB111_12490 [Clostridiaceae bacterium]|nr:hypothetical protein [Clostridiaceae bacterium]